MNNEILQDSHAAAWPELSLHSREACWGDCVIFDGHWE